MKTKPINCQLDQISPKMLSEAAEILRILAHPVRLKIIDLLNAGGPLPVSVISEAMALSQPTTSQHLNHMRRVGLLNAERSGKTVLYAIADPRPIALLNCICSCCNQNKQKEQK
jgi:DNA-binding transcriptional ArsR family regulator